MGPEHRRSGPGCGCQAVSAGGLRSRAPHRGSWLFPQAGCSVRPSFTNQRVAAFFGHLHVH